MRAKYRSARGRRTVSSRLQLVLALLLAGLALTAVTRRYRSKPQEAVQTEGGAKVSWTPTWLWGSEPKQEQWPETLVVYIFSNTDPEYFNNLKFFLKWGVREGDGAYYIIVVQEGGKSPVSPRLALTPGNLWLFSSGVGTCTAPSMHAHVLWYLVHSIMTIHSPFMSARPDQRSQSTQENTGRLGSKILKMFPPAVALMGCLRMNPFIICAPCA